MVSYPVRAKIIDQELFQEYLKGHSTKDNDHQYGRDRGAGCLYRRLKFF